LKKLPKKREIVAYCRGPYCVMAVQAVDMLRAAGFRARRLEEGMPDWRQAGHAVSVHS
jgi:ArsR family transcriptional regulator